MDGGQVHGSRRVKLRRLGIDTYQELVIYLRRDCPVARSEGFGAQARVRVRLDGRQVIATLNLVSGVDEFLAPDEAVLSESAWTLLGAREGDVATLSHPSPVTSFQAVRAKIDGKRLDDAGMSSVVADIVAGRYSDVQIAAFLTAAAARGLSFEETVSLTRAMIAAGDRIEWGRSPIVDKHCVGGLPGNRTTPLIVAIVAAAGLTIPKTSSRAITSPAGTADTMEVLTRVDLDLDSMRRVVESEGGCIVWGGSVGLSPADDVFIRVERRLDLDAAGQLVASVLSKKAAAGATHVLIDIPVGPTAKISSQDEATALVELLDSVGQAVGLRLRTLITDGRQPVGRGIGPALEARDVLGVLRGESDAPADLRERGIELAGLVLDLADSSRHADGDGRETARAILEDGRALRKFEAICKAQGGLREPGQARNRREILAARDGRVSEIDCQRLARVAKLAGAPADKVSGLEIHVSLGTKVTAGEALYTIHSESAGELEYALHYVDGEPEIVVVLPEESE